MKSLAATIVHRRIYYPRPIAALPDILMIELARGFRSKGLPLGRYYPVLVETAQEQREIEDFLGIAREEICPPDLLDSRPATLPCEHVTIAHYGPSTEGWPYVLLCRWPPGLAASSPEHLRLFARQAYTFDLFEKRPQLERASSNLLLFLEHRGRAFDIEIVPAEWSPIPGRQPH